MFCQRNNSLSFTCNRRKRVGGSGGIRGRGKVRQTRHPSNKIGGYSEEMEEEKKAKKAR
jgi:hypothetical protein